MLYTLNWKHKTRKALPLRLASKLAFKDVSLLEDRLFILQCNGRFINAMAVLSTQKQPDGQTSRFQRQIAFSLLWPVYQREAQWPFYQPDGQTSRLQRHIAFSLLTRTISLSAAGPSYSQQKQAQWPFYQREAQWPFYQGRSNRMARPPDFSDKLHFRYFPARSAYQRPGQAILSKSRPNGRFINARPNGRFINAEATGWPDLQISSDKLHFRYYPARSHGRAKLFSAKAGPMAVLSTQGPMAVLSRPAQM